jgi:hypothetical protein
MASIQLLDMAHILICMMIWLISIHLIIYIWLRYMLYGSDTCMYRSDTIVIWLRYMLYGSNTCYMVQIYVIWLMTLL